MEMNAINNVKLYESFYKPDRSSATEKKSAVKNASDSVAFSDTAKLYKAASSAMAKTPDIREDKVSNIKSMMDKNNYNVSSSQLADKLLSFI